MNQVHVLDRVPGCFLYRSLPEPALYRFVLDLDILPARLLIRQTCVLSPLKKHHPKRCSVTRQTTGGLEALSLHFDSALWQRSRRAPHKAPPVRIR